MATTEAVGMPAATSVAMFGPVSTPIRPSAWPGRTSAATSVMRFSEPCSRPLAKLRSSAAGGTNGAASPRTARKPWDGTARATTSAPSSASSNRAVAVTSPSGRPGR